MSNFPAIFAYLAPEDKGTILFGLVAFAIVAVPCAIYHIVTISRRPFPWAKKER